MVKIAKSLPASLHRLTDSRLHGELRDTYRGAVEHCTVLNTSRTGGGDCGDSLTQVFKGSESLWRGVSLIRSAVSPGTE